MTGDEVSREMDAYAGKIETAGQVIEHTLLGRQVMPLFNELTELLVRARVSSGTRIHLNGLDYVLITNPENDAEFSLMRKRDILTPQAPDEVLLQAVIDLPAVAAAFRIEAWKQLKRDVDHLNREGEMVKMTAPEKLKSQAVEYWRDHQSFLSNAVLVVVASGAVAVAGIFGAAILGATTLAQAALVGIGAVIGAAATLKLHAADDTISDDIRRHNELIARRRQHKPAERAEAIEKLPAYIKHAREFADDLVKRYSPGTMREIRQQSDRGVAV